MKLNLTHLATIGGKQKPLPWMAAFLATLFGANALYNYRGGYPMGTNQGIPSTPGAFNVAEIKLDFAAIAVARAAAGQAALAPTDVLELIAVPAGVWVPAVFAETLVVEGEAATVGVGDGVTPAGFLNAFDANVLGVAGSLGGAAAYSVATGGGKLYTVNDTIDIVLNTAAFNVAKMRFMAAMVDVRAQR